MKTIFKTTMLLLLLVSSCVYAQRGIGTNSPNKSAILELNSTTKGFLFPRMTMLERDAIVLPVEGLLVFCTDCSPLGFSLYTYGVWGLLAGVSSSPLAIESCTIDGTFVQDASAITRNLTVRYKQAKSESLGTLNFDASNVALSGAGAAGLAVGTASPASYTFTGLNDTVDVVYPISGTPTTIGAVTITVDYLSQASCGTATTVRR